MALCLAARAAQSCLGIWETNSTKSCSVMHRDASWQEAGRKIWRSGLGSHRTSIILYFGNGVVLLPASGMILFLGTYFDTTNWMFAITPLNDAPIDECRANSERLSQDMKTQTGEAFLLQWQVRNANLAEIE